MRTLLLLISYEQKAQTLEKFDVVKTVFARTIWTTEFSLADIRFQLMSTFTTKDPPLKEPPKLPVLRWPNTTQYVMQLFLFGW